MGYMGYREKYAAGIGVYQLWLRSADFPLFSESQAKNRGCSQQPLLSIAFCWHSNVESFFDFVFKLWAIHLTLNITRKKCHLSLSRIYIRTQHIVAAVLSKFLSSCWNWRNQMYIKQMQQYRPKSFVLVGGWVHFVSYSLLLLLFLLFKQQDFRAKSQDGFSPLLRLIPQAWHPSTGTRLCLCRIQLDWHFSTMNHKLNIWMLWLLVARINEDSLLVSSELHAASSAAWPRADLGSWK